MKILMIGDIVGRVGRQIVANRLPELKEQLGLDFVVANIENAAAGFGITSDCGREILSAGVDVMTSGNHVYDKKEGIGYVESELRLIRPANYAPEAPGRGMWLQRTAMGVGVAVINIQGRVFMPPSDCPFRMIDKLLNEVGNRASIILVDHHAEATSEKMAMGRYLDGRVTAVVGTHTHVQTADEQLLPGGTAYITDLGMTGPHSGVIGMDKESVLGRFLRGMPTRFDQAEGQGKLNGLVIEADDQSGRANSVERISIGIAAS
ncbi:MAG TPA: TIGR00282 family metallophosphoesterase [Blastocatellia bacterium]|nr:TIGR00282 family metallophosphoesterase [Blastocatellia bacterium]